MEINLARIFGDTTSPNLMTCYTFFFMEILLKLWLHFNWDERLDT